MRDWQRTVLVVNIKEEEFVLCSNYAYFLKDLQPIYIFLPHTLPTRLRISFFFMRVELLTIYVGRV